MYLLREALRGLGRFRLRTGLALVTAALGVAGASVAFNYVSAGQDAAARQIERLGTRLLTIRPANSHSVGGRARTGAPVTTLGPADYAALRRELPQVERASAVVQGALLAKAGDLAKNGCLIMGVEPAYFPLHDWEVTAGSVFSAADERRNARVALLGAAVAQQLFAGESAVGSRVLINRVPFHVVGVLAPKGQGLEAADPDAAIYIPLNTAMHRLLNVDYYAGLVLQVGDWRAMDDAAAQARHLLLRRHRSLPGQPPDFEIQNQKSLLDTAAVTAARLRRLAWLAGIVTLMISGLGIFGVQWLSVRARGRELAARRALGATRPWIFAQVFLETVVIALAGAGVGLVVAREVSFALERAAGFPALFLSRPAAIALAASVMLNLSCSFWPARRAALSPPARALAAE